MHYLVDAGLDFLEKLVSRDYLATASSYKFFSMLTAWMLLMKTSSSLV